MSVTIKVPTRYAVLGGVFLGLFGLATLIAALVGWMAVVMRAFGVST